jgi:hypothetical protein
MDEFDELYGSKYIGAAYVGNQVRRLRIERVYTVAFPQKDGSTKTRYALTFNGERRLLPLNITNARQLAKDFGKAKTNWVGKVVELYSVPTSLGDGVRLRAVTAPKKPAAATAEPGLDDEIPDYVL